MSLHIVDGAAQERAKYAEIWGMEEYRSAHSPGLVNVDRFMQVMAPPKNSTLIDIGCGSGKAGLEFAKHGLRPTWLDITGEGLDPEVDRKQFLETPLWDRGWSRRRPTLGWDYGFCCDVMEHVPPEYVMLALDRIISACRKTWLQIALRPDVFGKLLLGEPLHLTVQPFSWWLVRLATIGRVIDARDLCGDGLYIIEKS